MPIAALCLNPAIDFSCRTDHVRDTHKMRSWGERYGPGGGGINVARVIERLGGRAAAHYLAGGATGLAFEVLMDEQRVSGHRIDIAGPTRISTTVQEQSTGREYRFVPSGPTVSEKEWQSCLAHIETVDCAILVASGSLPTGVPDDFYTRVKAIADRRRFRVALDTSGPPLTAALRNGGIYLVKPSLSELEQHMGHSLNGTEAIGTAARSMVNGGEAEIVAVTMGGDGAVLAQRSGVWFSPAAAIDAKSAVGAGDSFLGAMVLAIAHGQTTNEAFRYGIAAGAAAASTPGAELCNLEDVARLYAAAPPLELLSTADR